MQVPIIDLRRQHELVGGEILGALEEIVTSGGFVGGPHLAAFEEAFAERIGAGGVVGVSTGTAALGLALRAFGVGPGDEVVVPANTFIATAEAVALIGARPALCDVDPASGLATAETMEQAITDRTRVLVPVHLWGHVADMDPIVALARDRGLWVLEDAAQAQGARYLGTGAARSERSIERRTDRVRAAGSLGDAAAFSFYPAKNLGAIGEGGAIAYSDAGFGKRLRMLIDHGQERKHVHAIVGDNGRLASVQAAALGIKLRHLEAWNTRRREIAAIYHRAVERLPIGAINAPAWSESVYHQFVVTTSDRETFQSALAERGVASAVHYPTPIHLQPAFGYLAYEAGSFPVAESLVRRIVSLPMFPELTSAEIEHVVDALGAAANAAEAPTAAVTSRDGDGL